MAKLAVVVGNAQDDGVGRRGWFIGHFLERANDARSTQALEVKWGVHPGGEARGQAAMTREATTLSVLVSGRFRLRFPGREVVLSRQGDYVLWAGGVPHDWSAEEDSIVLTVRWPSKPADLVEMPTWPDATVSH